MLDWVLLGSGSNPILEYSDESYLEGKNKERLKLRLEGVSGHSHQPGSGIWLFLWSVQRPRFCLCLDKIMEWFYSVSFITVTECPVSR